MGQFKSLKQIFCKFKGQFDQGHQFGKNLRPSDYQYTAQV